MHMRFKNKQKPQQLHRKLSVFQSNLSRNNKEIKADQIKNRLLFLKEQENRSQARLKIKKENFTGIFNKKKQEDFEVQYISKIRKIFKNSLEDNHKKKISNKDEEENTKIAKKDFELQKKKEFIEFKIEQYKYEQQMKKLKQEKLQEKKEIIEKVRKEKEKIKVNLEMKRNRKIFKILQNKEEQSKKTEDEIRKKELELEELIEKERKAEEHLRETKDIHNATTRSLINLK